MFKLAEYFEMIFLEILLSVNIAGFPRAGHIYYCFLGNKIPYLYKTCGSCERVSPPLGQPL